MTPAGTLLNFAFLLAMAGDVRVFGLDIRPFGSVALLVGLMVIVTVERAGRLRLSAPWALLALLAACVWIPLSSQWAPTTVGGPPLLPFAYLFVIAFVAAALAPLLTARDLRRFWRLALAVAVVGLVLALLAGPGRQGRYSLPGGGPNVFARVMAVGVVAALALYLHDRRRGRLIVAAALVMGVLLSGSRGGLVALAFGLALAYLLLAIGPMRRRALRALPALLTAAVVGWFVLPSSSRDRIYDRLIDVTLEARYTSGRNTIWERAVDIAGRDPIVGSGLGAVERELGVYAHNLFLGVSADAGLVGLVLVVTPLLLLMRRSTTRSLRHDPDRVWLLVAGCVILVASMFSGTYYDTRFVWFFLFLAAAPSRREVAA